MKIAFAGTPEFGAHVLADLVQRGLTPGLVVSQPDRPAGRGRHPAPPVTVQTAESLGLPVLQTADINSEDVVEALTRSGADCLVVAAFGQLLRREILERFLCLNVHGSLLPAYRGAAPIARALMAGESETGVSIMRMTPGLDEGPWALQTRISISEWDDAGSLGRALALLGALGVERVVQACVDGTVRWTEQPAEGTYAGKLGVADRWLDPALAAARLHDRVRALAPALGCDARTGSGFTFKVLRSFPGGPAELSGEVGVLRGIEGRLFLGCAEGVLERMSLQPAGKRPMTAPEFLRGYGKRLDETLESSTRGRHLGE